MLRMLRLIHLDSGRHGSRLHELRSRERWPLSTQGPTSEVSSSAPVVTFSTNRSITAISAWDPAVYFVHITVAHASSGFPPLSAPPPPILVPLYCGGISDVRYTSIPETMSGESRRSTPWRNDLPRSAGIGVRTPSM